MAILSRDLKHARRSPFVAFSEADILNCCEFRGVHHILNFWAPSKL